MAIFVCLRVCIRVCVYVCVSGCVCVSEWHTHRIERSKEPETWYNSQLPCTTDSPLWAEIRAGRLPWGHRGEDEVKEMENQYPIALMGYSDGSRRRGKSKTNRKDRGQCSDYHDPHRVPWLRIMSSTINERFPREGLEL